MTNMLRLVKQLAQVDGETGLLNPEGWAQAHTATACADNLPVVQCTWKRRRYSFCECLTFFVQAGNCPVFIEQTSLQRCVIPLGFFPS